MNHRKQIKVFLLLTLMFISVFCLNVYGAAAQSNETLIVNAAWLDDDMLRLDVTDTVSGVNSSLALRLSDILNESDNNPYLLIQAVDFDGNQSGIIQIKNPFYVPAESENNGETQAETPPDTTSAIPANGTNPFTPTGTGTVVDNATDGDGKEFLTIFTEDGNEFFLIIDRHRSTDNVYLLNTVTEEDLMSLADKNGRNIPNSSVSAIPNTPPSTTGEPAEQPSSTEPTQDEPEPPKKSGNNSNLIIIILVAAVVGGGAYYFKVVKGKNQSADSDDEDEEDDGRDYDFVDENADDNEDEYLDESEDKGGGE